MEKKTSYKYCIVPKCTSTTIKTPEKLFFNVPRVDKIREKWCIAMKRGNVKLSESSRLYCCEDHFNVEQDMKNYWRYRVMGSVAQVKLKAGVMPHIFECQQSSSEDTAPEWNESEKRRFLEEVLGTVPTLTSGSGVSQKKLNVRTESPPTYDDSKEKIYCRLCLKPTSRNSSIALCVDDFNYPGNASKKAKSEVQEILKMLNFCLPFFDTLTFNPIICTICLGKLKGSYEFANECARNQRLIEKYAETLGLTEKIVNIVEMIESKFTLPENDIFATTKIQAPTENIPKDPKLKSWRQTKRKKYSGKAYIVAKKQKICHESHNLDSSTGSNQEFVNVKIEPDSDDSSTFNKLFVQERRVNKDQNNVEENVSVKIESTYIDSPDFVKIKVEDDLHVKNELCKERIDFETDIDLDGQPSYFHGSVSEDTDMPSFTTQKVFSGVGSNLDAVTADVIK